MRSWSRSRFGEVVHVDDSLDLSLVLLIGEYSRAATFVDGSGTKMLTFRYVVQEIDYDDDGISIGPSALRGGTIEDAAGNAVDRTFAGLEADIGQTVVGRVDRVIPAILSVDITSDAGSNDAYTTDDVIRWMSSSMWPCTSLDRRRCWSYRSARRCGMRSS